MKESAKMADKKAEYGASKYSTSKYDTPNKRRRYIESEFRRFSEVLEDVTGKSEAALLHGAFGTRKTKALLAVLDRAETEFGKLCKTPILETLVDAEIRPLLTYNSVNQNNDLTIGAALWILDTMRKTEHFREMTELLPDLTGEDPLYLPLEFSHPCFSNNLIQVVMHVLIHKHTEKRKGRDWRGIEEREEHEFPTELASEASARGEKPEAVFTELMGMLPEEAVKKACENFKALQWNLLSRFIRSDCWMTSEIDRRAEMISGLLPGTGAMQTMPGPLANPIKPIKSINPVMGSMLPGGVNEDEKHRLAAEGEKYLQLKSSFPRRFSDFIQMDRRQIIRETGSRIMADELSGFTIEDPYEICFAIYYLIETDDDAPWLMSSGSQLCDFALRMLPWFVDSSNWDEDDWDSWDDAMTYDINGWIDDDPPEEEVDFYHTKHQGRTLAQIVYELSRGVVPVGKHPFEKNRCELIDEGMDERVARKVIDIAEMFFLREFQADTYKAFEPFSWEGEDEEDEEGIAGTAETAGKARTVGTTGKTGTAESAKAAGTGAGQTRQMLTPSGYWGRTLGIKSTESHQQTDTAKETTGGTEESEEIRSEELEQARKEIKALRAALYKERREARDDRAKYEHELKGLRMEHRELADLRSLVFNREIEDKGRLEKVEKKYKYPYETRKRTVIFGGHDSFLRAIKPMLPTVRFVDPGNLTFSAEIIRNADVVWIQNNCISHSQFWNIVKNCKLAEVQMRYFGFASAEKCAEQLVTEDLK